MSPPERRCAECGADISHRIKPGAGRPPSYCEAPETFTTTAPVTRRGVETGRRVERSFRIGTTRCQWTRENKRKADSDHRKIAAEPERLGRAPAEPVPSPDDGPPRPLQVPSQPLSATSPGLDGDDWDAIPGRLESDPPKVLARFVSTRNAEGEPREHTIVDLGPKWDRAKGRNGEGEVPDDLPRGKRVPKRSGRGGETLPLLDALANQWLFDGVRDPRAAEEAAKLRRTNRQARSAPTEDLIEGNEDDGSEEPVEGPIKIDFRTDDRIVYCENCKGYVVGVVDDEWFAEDRAEGFADDGDVEHYIVCAECGRPPETPCSCESPDLGDPDHVDGFCLKCCDVVPYDVWVRYAAEDRRAA